MATELPEANERFLEICEILEKHYKDMQDMEFTIERGRLWMLQTRNGKRTAAAAIKIAVDMANEGLIGQREAIIRVTPEQVNTLLHPQFDADAKKRAAAEGKFLAKGVNASPGAAVGQVYFDADLAEAKAKEGQDVVMARPFTKPDDVHGMIAAKGILTSEGGATSHTAVVARQFGKPCVVGASALHIDLEGRTMSADSVTVKEGEWISVNGGSGEAFVGKIPTVAPKFEEQQDLVTLLAWADDISATPGSRSGENHAPTRGLQVWANADYPRDAQRARAFGALGIGLCRTEHMFFETSRLPIVQRMILSKSSEARTAALNELLPFQRSDFDGLFEAMTGLPVIIRLIDPPLHEFLPSEENLLVEVTKMKCRGETAGLAEKETMLAAVQGLHESNPMMGLRGIRLSIVMPEIVEMQVARYLRGCVRRQAAGARPTRRGDDPAYRARQRAAPDAAKAGAHRQAGRGREENPGRLQVRHHDRDPRAALTAGEIASLAEFFSFGTNDLTQMTYGYSRDDAERNFLLKYVEDKILPFNPFQTIDREGVGRLMAMCVTEGRKSRPSLEVGICGEHGGDPSSVEWCHLIGNNYVSCSPFRVPVARLAAGQAAVMHAPAGW